MKAYLVKKTMEICGSLDHAVECAWGNMDVRNKRPIVTRIFKGGDYDEYRVIGVSSHGRVLYRTIEAVEIANYKTDMDYEFVEGDRW